MIFNFQALKKYVRWGGGLEELCELLNQLGIEVEGVVGPGEDLEELVVGEIVELNPHPNADKLTVCQVDVGSPPPKQIVCGAANHSLGSKVVVVQPGQVLPGGFKIEKRKIRNVESQGMMCSLRELGLGDEHEGIILLPDDASPGDPIWPYLTDVELSITPNRPDLLGWVGIAREIAAATGQDLMIPEADFPFDQTDSVPIRLEDSEGCPRYLGRVIRGVQIAPSPLWLQNSLKQVGLSPINNVVDVTNFVLMELGHPLHAFDLAKLSGPEIRVRQAHQGETFQALNGLDYVLGPEHLVIADAEKIVALAGVMGGANSEVTEATSDLFIECAYFHPSRVRRSAKSAGLATDSSYRFERGMDPRGLEAAIDRCVGLILETAAGRVTSDHLVAEKMEHAPVPATVTLRPERASEKIGASIPESEQADILTRLGCSVTEKENGTMIVSVPGFRPDLGREVDLIEELARHHGYENIGSVPPLLPSQVGEVHPAFAVEKVVRSFLLNRAWIETKSFSFTSPDFSERLELFEDHSLRHSVAILNPITSDTSQLRTTLLGSLLESLAWNVRHGERSLRIFETGRVYLKDVDNLLDCERDALGLAWLGSGKPHWSSSGDDYDFFDAKGAVEALFEELGIVDFALESFTESYLYPGQSAQWTARGKTLGVVGRIHPRVSKAYDLPTDPLIAELDLDAIGSLLSLEVPQINTPSPFPSIRRDLSLTVPLETPASELLTLIRESNTPHLESVDVFDRYTGDQIAPSNQSLGFRLTYRSSEKTLTEEEIAPVHASLLENLNRQLGASQRGWVSETRNHE